MEESELLTQQLKHNLLLAQAKAESLFQHIEVQGLICSGRFESEVSQSIADLAHQLFGVEKHWHKRIVRAGKNTLFPYAENPPDVQIAPDDIVFVDLGPVFSTNEDALWEADFGRTFVLGEDPEKRRLQTDLETVFRLGQHYFQSQPGLTGQRLYQYVVEQSESLGWLYGGPHAGHLIGRFPHERIQGDHIQYYIHPENPLPMKRAGNDGLPLQWILEVHLLHPQRLYGGFFEQLILTL